MNGSDLTWRIRTDGSCVPIMPRLGYASAVLGLKKVGLLGTVSVALGPGLAAGDERRLYPGFMYRLDYSTPPLQRIALAVSGRGLAISGVTGSTVVLRIVNVGLRLR